MWGGAPHALGDFLEKVALNVIWISVLAPFEKIPLFTSRQVQNTFKILHFCGIFCERLGPSQEKQGMLPSTRFLALNK